MSRRNRCPAPRNLAWAVHWWDWRGHHDWIGQQRRRVGTLKPFRMKPPQRQIREFPDRATAENFVTELRQLIPPGELIAQVVGLPPPPVDPPIDQLLPGDWPLQRKP